MQTNRAPSILVKYIKSLNLSISKIQMFHCSSSSNHAMGSTRATIHLRLGTSLDGIRFKYPNAMCARSRRCHHHHFCQMTLNLPLSLTAEGAIWYLKGLFG